jgi:hypothetical protein
VRLDANLRLWLVEIDANQSTVTHAKELYAVGRMSIVDGGVRRPTCRPSAVRRSMDRPTTVDERRERASAHCNYPPPPIKVVRRRTLPFSYLSLLVRPFTRSPLDALIECSDVMPSL